jgi:hypothetical protein
MTIWRTGRVQPLQMLPTFLPPCRQTFVLKWLMGMLILLGKNQSAGYNIASCAAVVVPLLRVDYSKVNLEFDE